MKYRSVFWLIVTCLYYTVLCRMFSTFEDIPFMDTVRSLVPLIANLFIAGFVISYVGDILAEVDEEIRTLIDGVYVSTIVLLTITGRHLEVEVFFIIPFILGLSTATDLRLVLQKRRKRKSAD